MEKLTIPISWHPICYLFPNACSHVCASSMLFLQRFSRLEIVSCDYMMPNTCLKNFGLRPENLTVLNDIEESTAGAKGDNVGKWGDFLLIYIFIYIKMFIWTNTHKSCYYSDHYHENRFHTYRIQSVDHIQYVSSDLLLRSSNFLWLK